MKLTKRKFQGGPAPLTSENFKYKRDAIHLPLNRPCKLDETQLYLEEGDAYVLWPNKTRERVLIKDLAIPD